MGNILTPRTISSRKIALFLILLLLIFHWLFVSPVIRHHRSRAPISDPWRKGADVLTQLHGAAVTAEHEHSMSCSDRFS